MRPAGRTPVGEQGDPESLAALLRRLRELAAGCRFGLATVGAADARRAARDLIGQLDDYVQPRLDRLTGPLLMVVCGPTGSGKSTLVNSLVGAPVSDAGALRPTTRAPILVTNPADASWFTRFYLLPTFTRSVGRPSEGRHLQVVAAPSLPAGVALLDAPDIDSVVEANRSLATDLMGSADLWLFVTTANRYADAVPWQALRTARDRGTRIALVLDRVPGRADRLIHRDLSDLLGSEGFDDTPIFDVPESILDHEGLLPEEAVAQLHDWFGRLAADVPLRGALAAQALDGVLATLPERIAVLADESVEQRCLADHLRTSAREAHQQAVSNMDNSLRTGVLLSGELLARWDELVAGGELLRAVQSRSGRLRDQLGVSFAGRSVPGRYAVPAAGAALRSLLRETLDEAARRTAEDWEATPAGEALLSEVDNSGPGVDDAVTGWLDAVLDLVRNDAGQRSVARQTTYTLHAVRLMVIVAVLIAPARADGEGTERDMIDTVLADPVVRRLAEQAGGDLRERFGKLVDQQRRRYDSALNRVAEDGTRSHVLREVAAEISTARGDSDLAPELVPVPPVRQPRVERVEVEQPESAGSPGPAEEPAPVASPQPTEPPASAEEDAVDVDRPAVPEGGTEASEPPGDAGSEVGEPADSSEATGTDADSSEATGTEPDSSEATPQVDGPTDEEGPAGSVDSAGPAESIETAQSVEPDGPAEPAESAGPAESAAAQDMPAHDGTVDVETPRSDDVGQDPPDADAAATGEPAPAGDGGDESADGRASEADPGDTERAEGHLVEPGDVVQSGERSDGPTPHDPGTTENGTGENGTASPIRPAEDGATALETDREGS